MDLVERVARALCIAQGYRPTENEMARAADEVRAVLMAIREPTPEMVVAGDQAFRNSIRFDKAALAWQAMIDAALTSPASSQAEGTDHSSRR